MKQTSTRMCKTSRFFTCAVVVLSAFALPTLSQAAQIEINGEWMITSGGSGVIRVAGDGGIVTSVTSFGNECTHPLGEVVWTEIIRTSDINFVGKHQYLKEDCSGPDETGQAWWTMKDSNHMTACSTSPDTGATGCSELTRLDSTEEPDSGSGDSGSGGGGSDQGGGSSGGKGGEQQDNDWPDLDYLDILKKRIYELINENKKTSAKVTYSVKERSDVNMRMSIRYGRVTVAGSRYKAEGVEAGAHSARFRFSKSERKRLRKLGRKIRRRNRTGRKNRTLKVVIKTTAIDSSGNQGSVSKTWKINRYKLKPNRR